MSVPNPEPEVPSRFAALTPGRRELALAWVIALIFAAVPLRRALIDGDRVLFAVDTVTTQLPWAAALPEDVARTPVNPDLSDQGTVFYPFYRWVSASWRSGDDLSWCPLIYAGAPGIANAQAGVFDPQVLVLVGLEAVGGKALFDRGLALVAWLRVAAALAGAFALARRLGLGRAGAALTGVSFGLGGFLTLWLNHPLGHVAPYLPWLLYFLEGTRGPRALRSASAAGFMLLGAILGGHVETAFFVGAAGGAWALALLVSGMRRGAAGKRADEPTRGSMTPGLLSLVGLALGGLAGAIVLIPTMEYLNLSAAKAVRELSAARATHDLNLVALGLVVALLGMFALGGRLLQGDSDRVMLKAGESPRRSILIPTAIGLSLALLGVVLLLLRQGFGHMASLAIVPDRLGSPGATHHYAGTGNYIESASAWVPFAVLVLAIAAGLSATGNLRRRGLILFGGLLSFLLAVELPGLLDLYRFLPLVGLGATVRLAVVSSLFLGLLAGDALERASTGARVVAVLALLPLVAIGLVDSPVPSLPDNLATSPEGDELVHFARLPEALIDGEDSSFECWVHPSVPIAAARLMVTPLFADGTPMETGAISLPLQAFDEPTAPALAAAESAAQPIPEDARWLRTPYLLTSQLATGAWRAVLEVPAHVDVSGVSKPGWSRRAAVFRVQYGVLREPWTLLAILVSCLVILFGPKLLGQNAGAALVVLVALGQASYFGRNLNPLLPRSMIFEESATERVLARELGVHRFQADPGVLPPDSGLVRGLRHVEGYDAMDPKAFNDYRSLFLTPGVSPLLAWNARAVNHDDPAYRMLGVKLVAMREPWSHPRFDLVASPDGEGDAFAETWIYRDRDPLPRAFAVNRVGSLDDVGAIYRPDHMAWDPLTMASVASDWRPENPFTTAEVSEPEYTNATVRLTVTLDGDGLLVLTDQHFPGWIVEVDGERRDLELADMNFLGVGLEEGTHEVLFRYAPRSIQFAGLLSLASIFMLLALGVTGMRKRDLTLW